MRKSAKIIQSNSVTLAKMKFSLIERRVFYVILNEVYNSMYDAVIPADKSVVLSIETKKLLMACPNFTVMYKALVSICKKTIEINNKEYFYVGHIVNSAEHVKREPTIDIELNKKVLHLFLRQKGNFTTYNLLTALSFKSIYTQRLYEFCSMNYIKGSFSMTVCKLQELFGCNYKLTADFFKKVIVPAQKELYRAYENNNIDFYFNWDIEQRDKKKIVGIAFTIYKRERTVNPQDDTTLLSAEERATIVYNICFDIEYHLKALKLSYQQTKDKVAAVCNAILMSKTPNATAITWHNKIARFKNTYKNKTSIAKVLLHAIHRDTHYLSG